MIIAVDFDGTCVTHEYPRVGREIGASYVLKELVKNGHRLVLNTMRGGGEVLDAAVGWFASRGIPLYGVNETPSQKSWTGSPKVYAQIYIDDAALGCPLVHRGNKEPVRGLARRVPHPHRVRRDSGGRVRRGRRANRRRGRGGHGTVVILENGKCTANGLCIFIFN